MPPKNSPSVDIFDLLSDSGEKADKPNQEQESAQTTRQELLSQTKVKDLFPQGTITINKYTCVGVQCKLCIKACPTNALYWTSQGIGITEDLCVHCQACVLSCMVENCIKVTRKKPEAKNTNESFSNTRDIVVLNNAVNANKRLQRIRDIFSSAEEFCQKYGR